MDDQIRAKIEQVREMLKQDGGDCHIVKIEGKTVTLELSGACGCCPFAMETLKGYVQEELRRDVDPELVVERFDPDPMPMGFPEDPHAPVFPAESGEQRAESGEPESGDQRAESGALS